MDAVVVVPTIREDCIKRFLKEWRVEFGEAQVIVVEDNPTKQFEIEQENVTHYAHDDIDRELGDRSWIIPRKTDCVRSFGYWKAWQLQPDMIVTLDDDCYPTPGLPEFFLDAHWGNLERLDSSDAWASTIGGERPRGLPYENTTRLWPFAISHGLWTGAADLDSLTRLTTPMPKMNLLNQTFPKGFYFPMCGMNLAWCPEVAPMMYFGLQGKGWLYDRFGDIWCGVIVKKICDYLGYAVWSGTPYVRHERASNVWNCLHKEHMGIHENEHFWQVVDAVRLTKGSVAGCYWEIAVAFAGIDDIYYHELGRAMLLWLELFQ